MQERTYCVECGDILPRGSRATFCGVNCQKRAWRRRQRNLVAVVKGLDTRQNIDQRARERFLKANR